MNCYLYIVVNCCSFGHLLFIVTTSTNNTITIGFLYMMVPNDPVTHSVCVIRMRLNPEIPLHKEASFGFSSPPQLLSLAVQVASHTAGDKNCGGGQQTGLDGIHAEWFFSSSKHTYWLLGCNEEIRYKKMHTKHIVCIPSAYEQHLSAPFVHQK